MYGAHVGQAAPDFAAQTLDGERIKLSELRGKVVFIDFWATWCAPCVAELPNVKKAHEQFAKDGLVIIGISFDKDAKTAEKYVKKKELNWPQVWAEGGQNGELGQLYGVGGIPATFLIGPDGKVVGKDLRDTKLHRAIEKELGKLKEAKEGDLAANEPKPSKP